MSIQLQMEQMPGYLAAMFIGAGVPEDVWGQFVLIAEHCKRTKNNKLLIDLTGAEGEISFVERFFLGKRLGIFARYSIKVVFVGRPEQVDPRKFAAVVAQNRGVNVDAFSDFQAAEEWLLK